MERTTITSEVVASPLFLCACHLASRFAPWALFEAGPFVSDRCRILMELSGTTIISFSQPGGSTHLLPLLLLENLGPLSLGSSELFCFSREWKRWLGCNKSAKMVSKISKSLYGFPSSEASTTSSCALCKAWQATQMQTICHFAMPLGRINHRNHENEAPTHRDTPWHPCTSKAIQRLQLLLSLFYLLLLLLPRLVYLVQVWLQYLQFFKTKHAKL